ncbi:YceI family protein [Sphingomonas sp. S2-65]|uniref:YceI family protein n=1 Tax=Sphingomonas sp. S2-65 TaxID=2903960 RepID=UPI001F2410F6|nr:YceI family protein [Sphingomonas sp. S2-65]UYY58647.1 YceI family protein [Sphingomonas sp. S2-65]
MRARFIALAATLAIATPLIAQQAMQVPGSKNPALVTAGSYTADPGHTLVEWTVDHLGFTPYFGIFGDVSGTLTLDPKNLSAAKVDVTIPVSKLTTANAGLTAHMLRAPQGGGKPDFFGANPADARFVSTRVVATGQTAKVTGNLTLNGVTKPVTLDASFYGAGKAPEQMGGKEAVGFEARGSIKRSDFGVAYGTPVVSDEVKLKIVAAFNKN